MREQYLCTWVQESSDPTLIHPYVQPLNDNNQSARAAEQRENIHNMRCFVRQTLSALAAK